MHITSTFVTCLASKNCHFPLGNGSFWLLNPHKIIASAKLKLHQTIR